jgi:hypothetical protein
VAAFKLAYGAKFGKVVDDLDELLAFYDFPAEFPIHKSWLLLDPAGRTDCPYLLSALCCQ